MDKQFSSGTERCLYYKDVFSEGFKKRTKGLESKDDSWDNVIRRGRNSGVLQRENMHGIEDTDSSN